MLGSAISVGIGLRLAAAWFLPTCCSDRSDCVAAQRPVTAGARLVHQGDRSDQEISVGNG